MFAYCLNNPIYYSDSNGNLSLPNWAKITIGVAVIATAVIATVATAGAAGGTVAAAIHCVAMGAAEGAAVGAATGAVSGAVTGVITEYATTGSLEGAVQAAVDGAATGFMTGAVTGAITGAATSSYCFVAGTTVLTSSGMNVIERIRKGDFVWSWNENTGKTELKKVLETYINQTYELIHISINQEIITTTPTHPFYSPVKGWTNACELRAGDILQTVNGEYVVVEFIEHELLEEPVEVYNFQVEENHTYYVGSTEVLVHNSCRGNAVKKAWKEEVDNVRNGGSGVSRVWSADEQAELLSNGKVTGYVGHHMKSVRGYPNLAGDPSNIQFLTRAEHFRAHSYNWKTITHGYFEY